MTEAVDDSAVAVGDVSPSREDTIQTSIFAGTRSRPPSIRRPPCCWSPRHRLPVLVFGVGSRRWFYLDEWDFLATRSAASLGDLFRPHNENLSTIPILVYRAVFNLFHLHSLLAVPVAVVVLAHLVAGRPDLGRHAPLRGQPVGGPAGRRTADPVRVRLQDIVWAFQIGFTGALALGLAQLLLADHDGPLDRRDVMGAGGRLRPRCCARPRGDHGGGRGRGLSAAAGLARGRAPDRPRWALFYLVWSVFAKPAGPANPFHGPLLRRRQVVRWDLASIRHTFLDLGHFAVVGAALGAMLVVGLSLAWIPMGRPGSAAQSMVMAPAGGLPSRSPASAVWAGGSSAPTTARSLATCTSPSPCCCRLWAWPATPSSGAGGRPIPVVVVLLASACPPTSTASTTCSPARPTEGGQQHLAAIGQSPLAGQVDQTTVTQPAGYPGLTVAVDRRGGRQGWLPQTVVPPFVAAQMPLDWVWPNRTGPDRRAGGARQVSTSLKLQLPKGSVFWVTSRPAGRPHPAGVLGVADQRGTGSRRRWPSPSTRPMPTASPSSCPI